MYVCGYKNIHRRLQLKENEEKIVSKKADPYYSETAYDDAFRTMEGRCDDLLIPLVGHMFGEKYDKSAVVKRLRNEHFVEHEDGSNEKRITDSSFEITFNDVTKKYHLECESKPYDGTILIRMFEYGSQIAKDSADKDLYKVKLNFPNSGLLLLKDSGNVPDVACIEIIMPDNTEVTYDVPIMKVSDYTIDDIFKEGLLMLIPFYIFNYEDKLPSINENEASLKEFVGDYLDIFARLDEELKRSNLSVLSYSAIIRLTHSVAYKKTMGQANVQKRVGDVMGGKVLDLPEFILYDKIAEIESERDELAQENEKLKHEIEELKRQMLNKDSV